MIQRLSLITTTASISFDPSGYINYMRPGPPDHTYPQGAGGGGSGVAGAMCRKPPKPCSALRAAVVAAKSLSSSLGKCVQGMNIAQLTTRYSAYMAQAGARALEMRWCHSGGDKGHQDQMQQNIRAASKCVGYMR